MRFSANVEERRKMPPKVAVSTVLFSLDAPDSGRAAPQGRFWLPLVRRIRPPHLGRWALPGGSLTWNESLEDVARRTLLSASGHSPTYIEQLATFGAVGRSPSDQRLVTVVYWSLLEKGQATTSEVPANVAWFPAEDLPEMAFDHREIVDISIARLRLRMTTNEFAHRFLTGAFTLSELRHVHEAVRGVRLDPANFRRQVLVEGNLQEIGIDRSGRHRPARLYRFTGPAVQTEKERLV